MINVLLLLASMAVSLAAAQQPSPSPYPPPGKLVDVGGYRVHLNCTGSGSPAVMIVGGGFSFDWDLVQSQVAKFTRVCTYDVSGTAWSDPGPTLTCSQRVNEIRAALQNAGVERPYVLVGLPWEQWLHGATPASTQARPQGWRLWITPS